MRELRTIETSNVITNPYQPRHYFNEEGIQELASSIKENGLIQPISVREVDGKYEIIVGERRFRALCLLGIESFDAYVLDEDESGSMNKALIENIQREDLSSIEEARAYLKIMAFQNINQSELAKQVGKSQSSIANKIRLLNLDDTVQQAVESKIITERHARAMLSLNEDDQKELLDKIQKEHLTVDQTEKRVKLKQTIKKEKKKTKGLSRNVLVAINTMKAAINMITKTGIDCDMSQDEDDEYVIMKVKIKK